VPLAARGYRFTTTFPEATMLGEQAEVRISGVPVGRVVNLAPSPAGRTRATIELQRRYAPLPADSRAMLRAKTLLGETYVELTPGTRGGATLADGGRLPDGQVSPTVELDEIFRTLDPRTRAALRTWMDQQALAITGHGRDLNDALGQFRGFADDAGLLVKLLRGQDGELRGVVRGTGTVFAALSQRRRALRGAIDNWQRVFDTAARRDQQLAGAFQALPTFEREGQATVQRLTRFAHAADPVVSQLRPAARELAPLTRAADDTAPAFKALLAAVGPATSASRRGLPASERFLKDLAPALAELSPPLVQLAPLLAQIGHYKRDLVSFAVNVTAATQASSTPASRETPLHYVRAAPVLTPDGLALHSYPRIMGWERRNPYMLEGLLPGGLQVYDAQTCNDDPWPELASNEALVPADLERRIRELVLGDRRPVAPPCVQAPMAPGQTTRFPHIRPLRSTKGP
jgi:ABC-type transporter Mla subunit MlaD